MKSVGTPSATSLVMEGDLGISNWGNGAVNVDQVARHTVTLSDSSGQSPTLSIIGGSQLQPMGTPNTQTVTIETVYAVSPDPDAHTVTSDTSAGTVTVTLPGRSWSIRDSYTDNTVTKITTTHDATRATLTVTVELASISTVETNFTKYMTRKITILEP